MKLFNFKTLTSAICVALFLFMATATGDSDKNSSPGINEEVETSKKSKKHTPNFDYELPEYTPAETDAHPEEGVEEVQMYNSSESENASDEDEEIVIITNDTDEE